MSRLAVVGSRGFNDYALLKKTLDKSYAKSDVIVSGGATGADALAERYAKEKGLKIVIVKPDWLQFGKAAGPIRNELIVKQSDRVIAFWDGVSKGTASTIYAARRLGIPLSIVLYKTTTEKTTTTNTSSSFRRVVPYK